MVVQGLGPLLCEVGIKTLVLFFVTDGCKGVGMFVVSSWSDVMFEGLRAWVLKSGLF